MKKTREVKTPQRTVVRPAKVKTITEVYCDIGGEKVDLSADNHYGSGGHNCDICGRDICRKKSCFEYEDDPDDCNSSIRVCIICHPLRYKKYLLDYHAMLDAQEKLETDFYKMIKKESLGDNN